MQLWHDLQSLVDFGRALQRRVDAEPEDALTQAHRDYAVPRLQALIEAIRVHAPPLLDAAVINDERAKRGLGARVLITSYVRSIREGKGTVEAVHRALLLSRPHRHSRDLDDPERLATSVARVIERPDNHARDELSRLGVPSKHVAALSNASGTKLVAQAVAAWLLDVDARTLRRAIAGSSSARPARRGRK